MNRRDLLLNEMNIPQWVLTKPHALQGEALIHLGHLIKLVVVCDENHQHSQLFQDILYTLGLDKYSYQWVNVEQSLRISLSHRQSQPIFWLIQSSEQAVTWEEKFVKDRLIKEKQVIIWKNERWVELHQSDKKRQFWQQIEPFCQHFKEKMLIEGRMPEEKYD
ncbi:DNA polymerase III psi subunit [Nicoletella semolina]|uniref:DNA polymerase III subunit psi n=1 Tax=Nicoletella semolina TaxID=271160 RepID=A0A4V2SKB4_9PAST|nr:DNA polymerase III subunit psi [Nicoletella semolina]MDH2924158.1 hypothetical protein [Nicoletella semolina]TCP18946.1 DNA polymerase III psi subunit [Nicoletella semolina]